MSFRENFNWETWENIKILTKIIFILIIWILAGLFIYETYFLMTSLSNYLRDFKFNWTFWKFLFVIFIGFFIYYNYKLHEWIFDMKASKKEKQNRINNQEKEIRNFLSIDFKKLNSGEVNEKVMNIEKENFDEKLMKQYETKLKEKKLDARQVLKEIEYKEKLAKAEEDKAELSNKIRGLEEYKRGKEMSEEMRIRELRDSLNIRENKVFNKENLSEDEIKILEEEGYEHLNEYCVKENRVTSALVKSPLNHSNTHTFLVWSVCQLLNSFEGIERIQEHETRDADVTFMFRRKYYALEIETGDLPSKKKQAAKKVDFLNKKYPRRWMFIVSNRDLLGKYRKLGIAIQRNEVAETLQNLLKSLHPDFRV